MGKRLLLTFATIALLGMAACSGGHITLTPSSDKERIPQPKFKANDLAAEGILPEFSQIRVFELDNCIVPNCPIIWHVVVSRDRSPREIIYGALPSFGAQTIISSNPLETGKSYRLELGTAKGNLEKGSGHLEFSVDEEGYIHLRP